MNYRNRILAIVEKFTHQIPTSVGDAGIQRRDHNETAIKVVGEEVILDLLVDDEGEPIFRNEDRCNKPGVTVVYKVNKKTLERILDAFEEALEIA